MLKTKQERRELMARKTKIKKKNYISEEVINDDIRTEAYLHYKKSMD
jgi:hypothetical protein